MELDLDKFNKLAETAESGNRTTRSPVYQQLDKAFDTIYNLINTKGVTQKTIVKLLVDSGMKDLKDSQFTSWWSSSRIKRQRELRKADQEKVDRQKKASLGRDIPKIIPASTAPKVPSETKPMLDFEPEDGDIKVPWATFLKTATQEGVNAASISAILCETGVIAKIGGRYQLKKSAPSLFPDLECDQFIDFRKTSVMNNTLLAYLNDHKDVA